MKELLTLRSELMSFKVLDPACGSGNFLYVAYRELVRIEIALMAKLKASVSEANFQAQAKTISLVSPQQFYGIDRESFGVELAKVTLMLAKKLALDEAIAVLERDQIELPLHGDDALPLDNLDSNIIAKTPCLLSGRRRTPSSATRRTRARTRFSRSWDAPTSIVCASSFPTFQAALIIASTGFARRTII
jgi:hypothetical protein